MSSIPGDKKNLNVLAVSADEAQRAQLSQGLQLSGIADPQAVALVSDAETALEIGIDAMVIALQDDGNNDLHQIMQISQKANCPVALFLDGGTNANIGEIIDAGICTVVVDGLQASRIPRILEATLHRYKKMHGLQIQLENARSALEERKLIDRAKALLIEQRSISEPQAYKLLQRAAMNKNCRIAEIAQTVILASEV